MSFILVFAAVSVIFGIALCIRPIRDSLIGLVAVLFGLFLVVLSLWPVWIFLAILYVAYHFISKYW